MNVIERRLEILRIMNAKRKSNVAELAETLNVSTRTVQRDIQALITVVPLVCISGNGGGIQLLDGYHLHSNIFTKEEADVIKSVMKHSNEYEKKILTEILKTYASCYPKDFEQVQLEFARRKKLGKQYSGTQIFAAKLVCADCGCFFGSKVWHSNSKYRRVIWQCNNKFKGQQLCSTPHLYEDEVKQRFVNAFSVFFQGKEIVIETVQLLIDNLSDTSALDTKIEKAIQDMENTAMLNQMHIQNNIVTAKNKDAFDKRHDELVQQYESQKAVYDKLMQKKDDRQNKVKQLQQLILQLDKTDYPVDSFDENLWRTMIDKVTVFHDNKMIFQFLDGTEIEA